MESVKVNETIIENQQYAGFWKRVGAYIIDGIILAIPMMFIGNFILVLMLGSLPIPEEFIADPNYIDTMSDEEAFAILLDIFYSFIVTMIICGLLSSIYYIIFHASRWQATLGKKLLGIKVVSKDGKRITFLRSLARFFSQFILSVIFIINYLMAACTPKKQAIHDMIAGTYVVVDNKNKE